MTSGERFRPPIGRTAVGLADHDPKTVAVALTNARELELFVVAWKRLGWQVVTVRQKREFTELLFEGRIDLFVTDQVKKLNAFRKLYRHKRTPRMMLIADDTSRGRTAWKAGADAIMVRSIGHDDFFSYEVVERPD